MALHSGAGAFAVTRNGFTHVVWGEATEQTLPGAPTYIATIDRATRTLAGSKLFLAYAPPANDVHNTPGICIDSQGYLHVITGAHGDNFYYRKSLAPNTIYGGWSSPQPTLTTGWRESDGTESGRQTYLAFVCDAEDTLHIAFRQWRRNVDSFFPGTYYSALSYQRKTAGGSWEPAAVLVAPPVPEYCIYFHKLAVDRRGRLYLSYSFKNDYQPTLSQEGWYNFRNILFSADGGDTWVPAVTSHFLSGMR